MSRRSFHPFTSFVCLVGPRLNKKKSLFEEEGIWTKKASSVHQPHPQPQHSLIPMSSIGQNILMALALTLNQFASSNVQSVQRNKPKTPPTTTATTSASTFASSDIQRRGLLLSAAVAAAVDSRTELLKSVLH